VEVRDESMLPTLQPGDRLLVDPAAYRNRACSVGDLVVIVDPVERARWLVKRVVAVGPVGAAPGAADGSSVPAGSVWVLGDRPEVSRDSRQFGPVPLTEVVGRVYRRYAPSDRPGEW
jgi:hypothetical protein